MNHFNNKQKLQKHQERRFKNEEENIIIPKQNTKLKIQSLQPRVIIADFEAMLPSIQSCEPSGDRVLPRNIKNTHPVDSVIKSSTDVMIVSTNC